MQTMMKAICDTNIVSQYLEGVTHIVSIIEGEVGVRNIAITSIILVELNRWLSSFQGLTKVQREGYKQVIYALPMYHANMAISELMVKMSKHWMGLEPADLMIAATAIYHKVSLYTCNSKHFKQLTLFGLDLREVNNQT
ncbi:Predicted nucleic acid-binding protein, contains PIN domain [Capnocytophaga haemolytica]|uniref:PIN domain n=3 Tax=Capnocytophaga haemolytica TaxID=45243 RepID=A0AAX2GYX8_9FLAO|nr:Predicted nucleic acid-binding protein, contains PIN domain [Capnocytophaga haemolytica]SNV09181.1 PIN domain [Capnocytophaga haemolytica]